jgi:hypothetical protein
MGESEWTPERRADSSDGMVNVVRQHLRRLLEETPTPFPCRYACFIHPRRRQGERGFGVITPSGESLPLTVTMLEDLSVVPTCIDGHAVVVVGPGDDRDLLTPAGEGEDWSVPLPVTRISIQPREGDAGEGQTLTPSLEGPQLSLLCADRPQGWPP